MDLVNAPPRLIDGHGTPESSWLAWDGLADVPELPLDRWLRAEQRLVVLAPHPDDEILTCGALACMHAERGGSVLIVAVTDGEASHHGSPEWSPGSLAAERRTESAEGLALLIAAPASPRVVRLGLPDGGVAAHITRLTAEVRALLRPDDRLVTTWRFDGHPDHEASGLAAARASEAVGCELLEAPVWMWHWAAPGDTRVPWDRLRGFAISPEALARRRLAIAAHVTQLSPRGSGEGPVLTEAITQRLERSFEYFFL